MIDLLQIRKQAAKWWPDVLRAELLGNSYFPKALHRIGKVKANERLLHFDHIRQRQDELIASSKAKVGYGYTLHWVEKNFRTIGKNRFIDAVTFDTLSDYLTFLRRTKTYALFLADVELIKTSCPLLTDWCIVRPTAIEKHHGAWPALLAVVDYFQHRHHPDRYYIRELPISVPTKFVETHRKILSDLLNVVLPAIQVRQAFHPVKQFEQRYGLRYREPRLRLRLLDRAVAQTYFSGLDDLGLPLSDFRQLQLPLRRLIILENKTNYNNLMNFLTLPTLEATAGLFGSGFRVGLLKEVAWLHEIELYYWGDIDAHGLQILAQLRSHFPHVRPFLMDRSTFDAYPEYHTEAPISTAVDLPNLTAEELRLFHYLNQHALRLEQERIPQVRVREVMEALLG